MGNEITTTQSHSVALVSRETALCTDDYLKIQALIDRSFIITVPVHYTTVPVQDDLGMVYKRESVAIEGEPVWAPVGEINLKLLEAIKRPAGPGHIAAHLTRLAAHLRHTKGDSAWQIVIEDVARDLNGVSEWAVVRSCAEFRAGDSPFFPDTPALIAKIRKWDAHARKLGTDDKKHQVKIAKPAPPPKPTPEERQRVFKILHDAGIHRMNVAANAEFCEDCKREIDNQKEQP